MSSPKWTKEQLEVIESRECNLLVVTLVQENSRSS